VVEIVDGVGDSTGGSTRWMGPSGKGLGWRWCGRGRGMAAWPGSGGGLTTARRHDDGGQVRDAGEAGKRRAWALSE
jgi:hypothetical protein